MKCDNDEKGRRGERMMWDDEREQGERTMRRDECRNEEEAQGQSGETGR